MSGLLTLFVFCLIQKYFNTLSKGFKQQSVDEYTKQEDTDKSDSSRPEEPKDSQQDEIQEAEVID